LGREQDPSFSPTELINEIWLRKLRQGGWHINSRQHFYAVASLAMRQVLIEYARMRKAERRGGLRTTLSLDGDLSPVATETAEPDKLIQIGILMDQLERRNPETARIVDMHYFAGFTLEEIADISGLTLRQIRHRWEHGRDWLKDGLRR
jgi:RNA polymerase sigma factor (TIGR02999 family)